jgi:hypothetical protein
MRARPPRAIPARARAVASVRDYWPMVKRRPFVKP